MNTVPEAREILDLIVELYRIEHRAAERDILGTEAHGLLRNTESKAILDKIEAWIDDRTGVFPPRSKMGKAITYASNRRIRTGGLSQEDPDRRSFTGGPAPSGTGRPSTRPAQAPAQNQTAGQPVQTVQLQA